VTALGCKEKPKTFLAKLFIEERSTDFFMPTLFITDNH